MGYADDSATGFFERLGFDADPPAGIHTNRFHWGISHYIGSQLRQCVLDPDGRTLYRPDFPMKLVDCSDSRRLPPLGRPLNGPPAEVFSSGNAHAPKSELSPISCCSASVPSSRVDAAASALHIMNTTADSHAGMAPAFSE